MTDIRQFIRNLGDDAPAFFDADPKTIQRWVKTGSVPLKKAEKIFAAMRAMEQSGAPQNAQPPQTSPEVPQVVQDPAVDPLTHLPKDLPRGLTPMQGKPPDWIDIDPREQSFGGNFTRPGRVSTQPMPPMKLRDEGGTKVAYVDTSPKTPTVLPPTISNQGWADKGPPLPETIKKPSPYDTRPAQRPTEAVPQKQVP